MTYCKKCGATLQPGMKFCTKCGQPIDLQPQAPTQPHGFNNPQRPQPLKAMAPPDFVIASPKNLHQRVSLFSDVLPSALFGCKPPCSEVA